MAFMQPIMEYSTARSRIMSLLGAFALMAMIVRGLIPTGYMLSETKQPGQFVNIIICHGDGSGYSPAVLDLETGKYADPDELPGKSDSGKKSSCPYAVTAHFALPEMAAPLMQPVRTEIPYRQTFAAIIPGRGLAAPPPPARGPPLTV